MTNMAKIISQTITNIHSKVEKIKQILLTKMAKITSQTITDIHSK